jgi:hypothetical protein
MPGEGPASTSLARPALQDVDTGPLPRHDVEGQASRSRRFGYIPPDPKNGFPEASAGLGTDYLLAISPPVKTFLAILVALLMFATLGVLFAGLLGLVRGGGNPVRSNQLMRWRVILQGAALLLFALLMTLLRS